VTLKSDVTQQISNSVPTESTEINVATQESVAMDVDTASDEIASSRELVGRKSTLFFN